MAASTDTLAVPTIVDQDDRAEHHAALAYDRAIEIEALLDAVSTLHLEGILTEAEYEAKHRRLVAQR